MEGLELEDGRSVAFEISEIETIYGDDIDQNELDEHGDEIDRVIFWYEVEGAGGREYGTIYGPYASEEDVINAITDLLEDGSP